NQLLEDGLQRNPVQWIARMGKIHDRIANGMGLMADIFSILLCLALAQFRKMGEGREGRRALLCPARRWFSRRVRHLIPLVLIVVTVETEQLPVAPVGRVVVVVVILVVDRELVQLLPAKFAST